jgi:hypothetical protein
VPNGKEHQDQELPDFADLAPADVTAQGPDFSDLGEFEELNRRAGQFILTLQPEATAAIERPLVQPLKRVTGEDTPISFDEFLDLSMKINTGEVPIAEAQVGVDVAPFEGLPLRSKRRAIAQLGEHFVASIPGNTPASIARTLAGIVSFPVVATHNAGKEFLTTATVVPEEVRDFAKTTLGEFTPEEAAEARRMFVALAASSVVGAGAGMLATGLATRLGLAAGRPVTAGQLAFTGATVGGVAGGATFGFIEAPEEEKAARALAFGLMALPLGFFFKGLHAAGGAAAASVKDVTPLGRAGAAIDRAQAVINNVDRAIKLTDPATDTNIKRADVTARARQAHPVQEQGGTTVNVGPSRAGPIKSLLIPETIVRRPLQPEGRGEAFSATFADRETGLRGFVKGFIEPEEPHVLKNVDISLTDVKGEKLPREQAANALGLARMRQLAFDLREQGFTEVEGIRTTGPKAKVVNEFGDVGVVVRQKLPSRAGPIIRESVMEQIRAVDRVRQAMREGRVPDPKDVELASQTRPQLEEARRAIDEQLDNSRRLLEDDPLNGISIDGSLEAHVARQGRRTRNFVESNADLAATIIKNFRDLALPEEAVKEFLSKLQDDILAEPSVKTGTKEAIRIIREAKNPKVVAKEVVDLIRLVTTRQLDIATGFPVEKLGTQVLHRAARDAGMGLLRLVKDPVDRFNEAGLIASAFGLEPLVSRVPVPPVKQSMAVLPGLDLPGAAIRVARDLLGEDFIVAVHKRTDGQFDVAIGRKGSILDGKQKQFSNEGYITGMEVSYNGKPYRYNDALAGDKARITDVGTGRRIEVPANELRRTSDVRFGVSERGPIDPSAERVQFATVVDVNGEVFRGTSHLDAADKMSRKHLKKPFTELSEEEFNRFDELVSPTEGQVFETNRGRLVSAEEAFSIEEASGRILDESRIKALDSGELVSSQREYNRQLLEQALTPEELATYDNLVMRVLREDLPPVSTEVKAASNGYILDRSNNAGWLVRDAQTGEIQFRAALESDARAFIDRSGQANGPTFDGGSDVPPPIPGAIMPPEAGGPPNPLNKPWPLRRGITGRFVDLINTGTIFRKATEIPSLFQSFDNLNGTNLLRDVYLPTQDALLRSWALSKRFYVHLKEIDKIVEKMSPAEREMISNYRETMSWEEIKAGLFKSRPLSAREINAAELLAGDNIDTAKIYKFVRRRDGALEVRAKEEGLSVGELTPEMRAEEIGKVINEMKLTGEETNAAGLFDTIKTLDLDEVSLYAASRGANAIMEKSLSRAEFAAKTKMTGKQIKAAKEIDTLYDNLAEALGIDDARLIEGYLNHYRSQGRHGAGTTESAFLWQRRVLRGEIPKERQFVSEMIRAGEYDVYERDPITAAFRYIRAGINARELMPVWRKAYRAATEQLAEQAERKGRGAEAELRIVKTYLGEVLGIPDESVALTQELFDTFLEGIGLKVDFNVRRNLVNSAVATINSAALGFRAAMGFRDLTQFYTMYGTRFGFLRANNGAKLAIRDGAIAELRNRGVLPEISPVEFSTPQELEFTTIGRHIGKLPDVLNKVAEAGLKVSLQKNAYEFMHAAAYLDTREVALRELGRYVNNEISKEVAYKNIKVGSYDNGVIDAFNRLVDAGEIDKATDLLGKASGRDVAFVYGMGNHPYGWGTNIGRLAMQFGTWSVWARSYFARGLTQGTKAERLAFATRFAISQAALGVAGSAAGFNLHAWFFLPGLIFFGGPLVQVTAQAVDLASPFELDRAIAKSRLGRLLPLQDPRSLFLPGSYAIGDIMRAFNEAENPVEFFGRATGIPLSDGASMLDDLLEF